MLANVNAQAPILPLLHHSRHRHLQGPFRLQFRGEQRMKCWMQHDTPGGKRCCTLACNMTRQHYIVELGNLFEKYGIGCLAGLTGSVLGEPEATQQPPQTFPKQEDARWLFSPSLLASWTITTTRSSPARRMAIRAHGEGPILPVARRTASASFRA